MTNGNGLNKHVEFLPPSSCLFRKLRVKKEVEMNTHLERKGHAIVKTMVNFLTGDISFKRLSDRFYFYPSRFVHHHVQTETV